MEKDLEKKLTELEVKIQLHKYATGVGFIYLVEKGVIDQDDFNAFMKNAENDLKSGFTENTPNPLGLDYKSLVEDAFKRFQIPDKPQGQSFSSGNFS
jgi:hypothetical protein